MNGNSGTPTGGVVRVPVTTVRPSAKAFAKNVWRFTSGSLGEGFVRRLTKRDPGQSGPLEEPNAMSYSVLEARETGAAYIFDVSGVRLVGSKELTLTLAWSELARVALQIQHSELLGLKMLRFVWWPHDVQAFRAQHPECEPVWDPEAAGFATAIATDRAIPDASLQLALLGMAYAGDRFSGVVDEVRATG